MGQVHIHVLQCRSCTTNYLAFSGNALVHLHTVRSPGRTARPQNQTQGKGNPWLDAHHQAPVTFAMARSVKAP